MKKLPRLYLPALAKSFPIHPTLSTFWVGWLYINQHGHNTQCPRLSSFGTSCPWRNNNSSKEEDIVGLAEEKEEHISSSYIYHVYPGKSRLHWDNGKCISVVTRFSCPWAIFNDKWQLGGRMCILRICMYNFVYILRHGKSKWQNKTLSDRQAVLCMFKYTRRPKYLIPRSCFTD